MAPLCSALGFRMESRNKRKLALILSAVFIFISGFFLGYISSKSYFNRSANILHYLNRVQQSFVYAKQFRQNDSNKAKIQILSDLELSLSKLLIIKNGASGNMRKYICEKLSNLVEEKSVLLEFVDQIDLPESYPGNLDEMINALEKCD